MLSKPQQSPPPTPGPSSLAPTLAHGFWSDTAQPSLLSNDVSGDATKSRRRRPSRLNLATDTSPATTLKVDSQSFQPDVSIDSRTPDHSVSEAVKHLSSTLRGTPRRRPSVPFKKPQLGLDLGHSRPDSSKSIRPPEAFRDPSEHILSGKGSTLQHARSVYSNGPVEILPGLYLGDEHNACDNQMLSDLGITTILNVAKETVLPFQLQHHVITSPKRQNHWPGSLRRPGSAVRSASMLASPHPELDTIEKYHTPPTTSLPASADLSQRENELDLPIAAPGTSILRNTSSTPNLLTQFLNESSSSDMQRTQRPGADVERYTAQDVLRYRSERRESSSSSEDAFGSPCSSRAASTCTSATTDLTPPVMPSTNALDSFSTTATAQHTSWITKVDLPANATAMTVPASPRLSRSEMRYIKLPWTHDETDLPTPGGGFSQGCALIAEVLGLDSRVWDAGKIADNESSYSLLFGRNNLAQIQTGGPSGKILVHCQCGVSRSATLVIAFVMQAAAMRFGFTESESLMGMHDCYNMVKEKSASISPNISLIYQLVEWERYLSNAARRLRDVQGSGDQHSEEQPGEVQPGAGWSTETMDEVMWSKMRLEEEKKEAAEDARRKDERQSEVTRLAAERRPKEAIAAAHLDPTGTGSLLQRRRKKAAPSLQLQTQPEASVAQSRSSELQLGPPTAETPFHTARTQPMGIDGDVEMEDVEPPCTPLPRANADLDPACTPTANKAGPSQYDVRTPSGASVYQPEQVDLRPRSATLHTAATSLLSGEDELERFSFGGTCSAGAARPNAGRPFPTASNALFGVTALSREERRKQHRRTFSSDWPNLQPTSVLPRRGSKLVDSIDLPSDTRAPTFDERAMNE